MCSRMLETNQWNDNFLELSLVDLWRWKKSFDFFSLPTHANIMDFQKKKHQKKKLTFPSTWDFLSCKFLLIVQENEKEKGSECAIAWAICHSNDASTVQSQVLYPFNDITCKTLVIIILRNNNGLSHPRLNGFQMHVHVSNGTERTWLCIYVCWCCSK